MRHWEEIEAIGGGGGKGKKVWGREKGGHSVKLERKLGGMTGQSLPKKGAQNSRMKKR